MLDLLSLDPARQTADRRVALTIGYGALGTLDLRGCRRGRRRPTRRSRSVSWGALAGLPWVFAFGGRWRLLYDAVAGVPFTWRGDRAGVWATAPAPGALLALLLSVCARAPRASLVFLASIAGAAGRHHGQCGSPRQRYERLILLDLTALEQRFERIVDTRNVVSRRAPLLTPRRGEWSLNVPLVRITYYLKVSDSERRSRDRRSRRGSSPRSAGAGRWRSPSRRPGRSRAGRDGGPSVTWA